MTDLAPIHPVSKTKERRDTARDKVAKRGDRRLPTRVPMDLIEETLHRHRGNMEKTAKDLDLNYVILADYVEKTPRLLHLCYQHRKSMVDQAEHNLRQDLEHGSWKATQFTLKTLGRDRGFVERKEQEQHVIHHNKSTVNLEKLTSDQLRQLQDMMHDAHTDDPDVTDADYELIG